jgi:hypothetical protein
MNLQHIYSALLLAAHSLTLSQSPSPKNIINDSGFSPSPDWQDALAAKILRPEQFILTPAKCDTRNFTHPEYSSCKWVYFLKANKENLIFETIIYREFREDDGDLKVATLSYKTPPGICVKISDLKRWANKHWIPSEVLSTGCHNNPCSKQNRTKSFKTTQIDDDGTIKNINIITYDKCISQLTITKTKEH